MEHDEIDEIYKPGGGPSYFRDLLAAAGAPIRGNDPHQAQTRLAAHRKLYSARLETARNQARAVLAYHGIEARSEGSQSRALSNIPGMGAEMVPPTWMQELFAAVARAACPLKGLMTRVDLPPDTLTLHVPRFDTAAGVVPMQYENVDPPEALDGGQTDEIVSQIATFSGDVLLSQQLFDRGGRFADQILLKDFAENYGEALQNQLVNGTGQNGQLLGLRNVTTSSVSGVPGARVVTYTDGSPTPSKLAEAIARCAGQISDTRRRPPSAILMRGARWFWTAGMPDGSGNESVMRPGTGAVPSDTDTGPYGPLMNLPVYADGTLPANLGAGANQDTVVLARTSDSILLEDPLGPRFSAYPASNAAGQMTVVLQWHHYTAALTNLTPSAIGTVNGTGLAVPAGF